MLQYFLSIIVLLSVAPVRGFLFWGVRGPLLLGFPLGCFQLFGNRAGLAIRYNKLRKLKKA